MFRLTVRETILAVAVLLFVVIGVTVRDFRSRAEATNTANIAP